MNIYSSEQIRQCEQLAISEFGISEDELMARAGRAAFETMAKNWPDVRDITVITGAGNNGGDGFVLAKLAKEAGFDVKVFYLKDPNQLKGAALNAAKAATDAGVSMQDFVASFDTEADIVDAIASDLIVDGLLGTGLSKDVRGDFYDAIESINSAGVPVLALDIPSGINSDTGHCHGIAVMADVTFTFIGMKLGLYMGDAVDYCGEIALDNLDIPDEVFEAVPMTALQLEDESCQIGFLPRLPSTHKGDCGHVLIAGGDHGMAGAVTMAAKGAYRSGAGLVSVASHPEHVSIISSYCPEVMCHNMTHLEQLLTKVSIVVLGPGLGQSQWSIDLFNTILATEHSLVLDADALNLLAKNPTKRNNWILTPHAGEAGRLLNISNEQVQADRIAAARAIQEKYGGICVLKGPGSLVVGDEELIGLSSLGNPGMATGGMGDILTGIIAALAAQGYGPFDAAYLGVYVHAKAGDLAALQGERGMMATDLLPFVRAVVNPTELTLEQ